MNPSPSDANMPTAIGDPTGRTILGHPRGLFLLFFVEMWERFSFYGMKAILPLYLATPIIGMLNRPEGKPEGFNPGPGWSKGEANMLMGRYGGMAYLLPIIGGIIADKLLGTHRSMVIGALVIAAGHIMLFFSGLMSGDLNGWPMTVFMFGLGLIVIGTGHFKPCVSVMVGQLYTPNDHRRDNAFSIFYMGINVGALLGQLACGILGESIGWHYGFGAAAIGMILGVILYMWGRPKVLQGVGNPPVSGPNPSLLFAAGAVMLAAVYAVSYHVGLIRSIGAQLDLAWASDLWKTVIIVALVGGVLSWATWFVRQNRPEDRGPVVSILIFIMFNALFWFAFEQSGTSLNFFAAENTERQTSFGLIPASWFQSVNAACVILFTPVFAIMWSWLAKRSKMPSQPVKIALGLIFMGLGYVVITWGAYMVAHNQGLKASAFFLVATYMLHTVGELFISPTGLAYVTKTAPAKFVSLLMGMWFVSSFLAHLLGGMVAAQVEKIEKGEIKLWWSLGGQADFFMLFVVTSMGAGLLILALTPALKKIMRPGVQ